MEFTPVLSKLYIEKKEEQRLRCERCNTYIDSLYTATEPITCKYCDHINGQLKSNIIEGE